MLQPIQYTQSKAVHMKIVLQILKKCSSRLACVQKLYLQHPSFPRYDLIRAKCVFPHHLQYINALLFGPREPSRSMHPSLNCTTSPFSNEHRLHDHFPAEATKSKQLRSELRMSAPNCPPCKVNTPSSGVGLGLGLG